jgi:hypothetical protein
MQIVPIPELAKHSLGVIRVCPRKKASPEPIVDPRLETDECLCVRAPISFAQKEHYCGIHKADFEQVTHTEIPGHA